MTVQFGVHFALYFGAGGGVADLPPAPRTAAEVVYAAPDMSGHQGPDDAVTFDAGDGHVGTTGRAELTPQHEPEAEEEYHYRLCSQLQEAKPWIDWGCVAP